VQCDFDTVGTESEVADAETALVINAALDAAGVPDFTIALNNRKVLEGLLDSFGVAEQRGFVLRALDKLGKIGREGVLKELAGSAQAEKTGASDAPGLSSEQAARVLDFVDRGRGGREVLVHAEQELGAHKSAAEGIANLRTILDLLDAGGVPEHRVKIDLGLARGLDYYTGVVYETTVNGHERFGSVCSGGRYDNLASLFTSRRLPGVGASIGLDRLLALMDEAGWLKREATTAPVLVVNFPGSQAVNHVRIAARLRARGIGAEVFPDAVSLGKQLGYGSSRGHKLAVIIGPDEEARRVFNLRDLGTRAERKAIPWDDLESAVAEAVAQTIASPAASANSGESGS
jgi:histidyl-tRNA synthetase